MKKMLIIQSDKVRAQKQALRKSALEARKKMSDRERIKKSKQICNYLFENEAFRNAQIIHTYVSLPEEVDTHRLINKALEDGKIVLVPKVLPGSRNLQHYAITSLYDLQPGVFGILEPVPQKCRLISAPEPDAILVPGVAFDSAGNRLGYGKGYYDRFLSASKGLKIGLAFSSQILDAIPTAPHDTPVDAIATEKGIFWVEAGKEIDAVT